MADLEPSNSNFYDLVSQDENFKQKHKEILVNEKLSQINALTQRLNDLENIEAKKIKLKIGILEREISILNAKKVNANPDIKEDENKG